MAPNPPRRRRPPVALSLALLPLLLACTEEPAACQDSTQGEWHCSNLPARVAIKLPEGVDWRALASAGKHVFAIGAEKGESGGTRLLRFGMDGSRIADTRFEGSQSQVPQSHARSWNERSVMKLGPRKASGGGVFIRVGSDLGAIKLVRIDAAGAVRSVAYARAPGDKEILDIDGTSDRR